MSRSILLAVAAIAAFSAPAEAQTRRERPVSPIGALTDANAGARQRPDAANFSGATQMYGYTSGALYEVYGAPGFVSTVMLEPGEAIITVAAGDTTRWMVEEATGGDVEAPRSMLLLKPTRADIRTNIVLVTDRRTYWLEAIAIAGQTYSAQTAWTYPANDGPALAGGPSFTPDFNFAYTIRTVRGSPPRWRPIRVFDDGAKTYIEFPRAMATSEAPPLFITENGEAQLVNYRVAGNRYVVDRLFDTAELRLGAERPIVVRISRDAGSARTSSPRRRRHP